MALYDKLLNFIIFNYLQMRLDLVIYILLIFILFSSNEPKGNNCFLSIFVTQRFEEPNPKKTLTIMQKFVPNRTIGRQQKIPYNIFQTNQYDTIPWKMKYSIGSVIQKNPQFNYRYFNGTDRRNFIKQYMGKAVLDCYDKLIPNAYKADLFRLSVVYVYGGCYIDISYMAADSFLSYFEPDTTFVTMTDGASFNYALNAATFCATAEHNILYKTLMRIVESVRNQNYGSDSLDVTGPRKLAQGFKDNYEGKIPISVGQFPGHVVVMDREVTAGCLMSVFNKYNGEGIFASQYPDYRGDMQKYAFKPHYGQYYHHKIIYNKSIDVPEDYSIPTNFQNTKDFSKDFLIQETKEPVNDQL